MKNLDKVRQMSDEELLKALMTYECNYCIAEDVCVDMLKKFKNATCEEMIKYWAELESEE